MIVRFLCVILFINGYSFQNSYAQDSQMSKQFIRWFFKDKKSILYTDKLFRGAISPIKEYILKDTLRNFQYDEDTTNVFVFTDKEKRKRNKEIKKLGSKFTPRKLLPGSTLIEADTLNKILDDKAYGWANFRKRFGEAFYSFSKPMFFRNNTVCIFYWDYSCSTLCGEGELAVFRLVNGKWVKWLVLNHWVS